MQFGTQTLLEANKAHARPGAAIVLGPYLESVLGAFGVTSDRGVLVADGGACGWTATIDGQELNVGGGYDWMLADGGTSESESRGSTRKE